MVHRHTIILKNKSKRSSARAKFLASLIAESEEANLIDVGKSDFDIFFSKDLRYVKEPKDILIDILSYSDLGDTRTIFDVSDDLFQEEGILDSYLTLCVICSNFVTCSSEDMQEKLYTSTGRLAYILEDSDFSTATTNKKNNLNDVFALIKEDTFLDGLEQYLEVSSMDEGLN